MAQHDQSYDGRTLLAGGTGASILFSLGAGAYPFQLSTSSSTHATAAARTCVVARDCAAGYSVGGVSCFAAAGLVKTVAGVHE